MKSLQEYLTESINEAIEPETTFEVKDGKNFFPANTKAKVVNVAGNGNTMEIYFNKNSYIETINLQGVQAEYLRVDVEQCNKLEEINGGSGKHIHVLIRKNSNLAKVDLSGYEEFCSHEGGQVTYIDKNKALKLELKDLPAMVADNHGLDIDNGIRLSRGNDMTGKNKTSENK